MAILICARDATNNLIKESNSGLVVETNDPHEFAERCLLLKDRKLLKSLSNNSLTYCIFLSPNFLMTHYPGNPFLGNRFEGCWNYYLFSIDTYNRHFIFFSKI